MTRLLLVRHGETEHNVLGQISTHTHGSLLSEQGQQQARELAIRLSAVPVAAVYSSPAERAIQTATPLAEPHGLQVIIEERLRELSAGELDGRGDEEAFRILNAALEVWSMGDLTVRIGDSGDVGIDVTQRLRDVLSHVANTHQNETVVLVSHGGILQVAVPWLCSNLDPEYGHGRHVVNASVIELDCSRDVQCVAWADTCMSRSLRPTLT